MPGGVTPPPLLLGGAHSQFLYFDQSCTHILLFCWPTLSQSSDSKTIIHFIFINHTGCPRFSVISSNFEKKSGKGSQFKKDIKGALFVTKVKKYIKKFNIKSSTFWWQTLDCFWNP